MIFYSVHLHHTASCALLLRILASHLQCRALFLSRVAFGLSTLLSGYSQPTSMSTALYRFLRRIPASPILFRSARAACQRSTILSISLSVPVAACVLTLHVSLLSLRLRLSASLLPGCCPFPESWLVGSLTCALLAPLSVSVGAYFRALSSRLTNCTSSPYDPLARPDFFALLSLSSFALRSTSTPYGQPFSRTAVYTLGFPLRIITPRTSPIMPQRSSSFGGAMTLPSCSRYPLSFPPLLCRDPASVSPMLLVLPRPHSLFPLFPLPCHLLFLPPLVFAFPLLPSTACAPMSTLLLHPSFCLFCAALPTWYPFFLPSG